MSDGNGHLVQLTAKDFQIGLRSAGGVYQRGTLALLDGRTLDEENDGLVFYDHLPIDLDEIDQVEVVNGAGSAMWGSHALDGVVQQRFNHR